MLLLGSVGLVVDPSPACQSVVHGKFLLQLPNVLFVLFEQKLGVEVDIDGDLVAHLHHPRCEFQRRDSLLKMGCLRPNIGDHASFGISSNRVLEQVGQLVLAIGNVVSLLVAQGHDYLLQK